MGAQFEVVAEGTEPVSYQWYFNATNVLETGTNAILVLENVGLKDAGSYQVMVSNAYGSALSGPAELSVLVAPRIIGFPADRTVTNGDSTAFVVVVQGTPPVRYQWFFNETNLIALATNDVLLITGVTPGDEGAYVVEASNDYGVVRTTPARLTVALPPRIVSDPQDQNATNGQPVVLDVLAEGSAPLSYQWFFKGAPISEAADGFSLTIPAFSEFDEGSYYVKVSNDYGSATSLTATITSVSPPSLLKGPVDLVATNGDTVVFTTKALGKAPLYFAWYFNETNALAGETNSSLTLTNVDVAQDGFYSVSVTNAYGQQSASARLTVIVRPHILCGSDLVVEMGEPWSFDVPTATGTNVAVTDLGIITNSSCGGTFTAVQHWRATDEAGFEAECSQAIQVVDTIGPELNCPAGKLVQLGNSWTFEEPLALGATLVHPLSVVTNQGCAGSFSATITWEALDDCGNSSQCSQTVTVVDDGPPEIVDQPSDLVRVEGQSGELSILAQSCTELAYQWYFNETNLLADATNAVLQFPALGRNQSGPYTVTISNVTGAVTSSPVMVTVWWGPEILTQPESLLVPRGDPAVFQTLADGFPPPSLQWFLNETNALEGATSDLLTVQNVQDEQQGLYTVVASNAVTVLSSHAASLLIAEPPLVTVQPTNVTLLKGETARFDIRFHGTPPVTFQWYFNTTNLLQGATGAALSLTAADPTLSGSYSVTLSNVFGEAQSLPATLRVLVKPDLLVFTRAGDLVSFTFTTVPGLLYTIYYTDDFGHAWTLLPKPAPQRVGTGAPFTVQDPKATGPQRFYRILVE